VSGAFEALFGLSALFAPGQLISAVGTELSDDAVFLARILGAATLGIGVRAAGSSQVETKGGLAAAYGLALYNVLAGALILWTARAGSLGGAVLWSAGLIHAALGALFVLALTQRWRD
jgi:hypothetical protein